MDCSALASGGRWLFSDLRHTQIVLRKRDFSSESIQRSCILRVLSNEETQIRRLHSSSISHFPTHEKLPSMDLRESILNQTDFSLSLAKHVISAKPEDSNFVFSPLSIQVVLGLIGAGSGGSTRDQLLSVLRSKSIKELNSLLSEVVNLLSADGSPPGGLQLLFANCVWVEQSVSLKPAFKEIVKNIHKADMHRVDFKNKPGEVRKKVNTWVKESTRGLIKEIFPPGSIDPMTRLIFTNAIYFKGVWEKKFDAYKSEDHEFFLLNGTSIQVSFMTSRKKQYIRTFQDFKVLRLPYEQSDQKRKFSMYIFLPDVKDGLAALFDKISSVPKFIDHHIPFRKVDVHTFRIPKYKISFSFKASNVLKDMGLVHPCNCSGRGLTEMVDSITGGEDLYVSNIFHKAIIEVNEEGTEAAAVTGGSIVGCLGVVRDERVDFVADHPFLFVLREETGGAVLFMGQLLNPLSQ